jgi:CBS domain-containing protein
LTTKGSTVYTIAPDATLAEVVEKLVEHRIGSLLVCEPNDAGEDQLVGIITDRDLLFVHARACPTGPSKATAGQCPWMQCLVKDVMTRNPITVGVEDSVEQVMGLMTARRIRHLPVVHEGRLVGIVSIGDVVKAKHARLAMENQYMKDYIRG